MSAAIPILLLILLVFFAWRLVFSFNRDLVRARAWSDLGRRALPFAALTLMALTMFPVQAARDGRMTLAWIVLSAAAILIANLLSVPSLERRANRAFRSGDYATAAGMYARLAEERPLARHFAFKGAALGASERYEESVEASTEAVNRDPGYGLAYYNRALVLGRMGKKGRAKKDLQRALEADLPRRFRSPARKMLEELS
ncbi:MAG: hypothetical protein AB1425_03345 [Actinomycetota bacterium]